MKKISQVNPNRFHNIKMLHIKMQGGDDVYLNKKSFSLPGLKTSNVSKVEIIHCRVGDELKFSYSIDGFKKAIIETDDFVSEIKSENF